MGTSSKASLFISENMLIRGITHFNKLLQLITDCRSGIRRVESFGFLARVLVQYGITPSLLRIIARWTGSTPAWATPHATTRCSRRP